MSEPSANLPAAQPLDNGEGLRSKSFIGLLLTQLLTAINDNVFRWLVIGVGKDFVDPEQVRNILMAGTACFVLPYLLLAAPAASWPIATVNEMLSLAAKLLKSSSWDWAPSPSFWGTSGSCL